MRVAWGIRHAVMVMADGIDARTVAVAGTLKAIEGPEVLVANRETRRAIAFDFKAGEILEDRFGVPDIVEECCFRLFCCAFMAVAVACQFMSAGDDAPDEFRVALGHPTQREEGRLRVMVVQHRQDAIHVAFDAALPGRPLAARDVRRERGYLKVVLDVYGEGVGDLCRVHCMCGQAAVRA